MPENIIADTSCLVLLEKINELDVLHKLYKEIIITPEVADEFGSELPEWIEVHSVEDQKYKKLLETTVDPGEASVIALAAEIGGLVILDDQKARKLAFELELDVTGTLGILINATHSNYISSFPKVLDRIKRTNFYVSDDLEKKLIERLKK
jgi:predicted nucleic acid-binding protein